MLPNHQDLEQLKAQLKVWIGRTETLVDEVTPFPPAALAATLDRDDARPRKGDSLPPIWHWLYFLPLDRASNLADDGHAKLGSFLPPVPLPRRMWAGSRFEFHHPLRIGDAIQRVSKIHDVTFKEGRTGPLCFVTVHHQISNAAGLAIHEEHDIVYREHAAPGAPAPEAPAAPATRTWQREVHPEDVMLFRYSALTFNSHRIHYDRRYCTEVEKYPGLVVHGPLIATLLLDLLRRSSPEARVKQFAFRAVSPLFDIAPFLVCGEPQDAGKKIHLWAQNEKHGLAMDATAVLH